MTAQEALNIMDNTIAQVSLNREQHTVLLKAREILQQLIKEAGNEQVNRA